MPGFLEALEMINKSNWNDTKRKWDAYYAAARED